MFFIFILENLMVPRVFSGLQLSGMSPCSFYRVKPLHQEANKSNFSSGLFYSPYQLKAVRYSVLY